MVRIRMNASNITEWSNPHINLEEVTLRSTGHGKIMGYTNIFRRVYEHYLRSACQMLLPDENECFYAENFINLQHGKKYVVLLKKVCGPNNQDNGDVIAANVLSFDRYEETKNPERINSIHMKTRCVRAHVEYIRECLRNEDEYKDYYGNEVDEDDCYERISNCRDTIQNLHEVASVMAETVFHFKCVSTGTVFELDPFGAPDGVVFEIMDMTSHSWTRCKTIRARINGERQNLETDHTEGTRSMNALRDGYVRFLKDFLKENSAASCIQRHYRKAVSNPNHPWYRKRLREEFESDEDGINANAKRTNQ